MANVKDLVKDKKGSDPKMSKGAMGTLVKDLLSKSMSKGGKLKSIKVKAKFGSDKGEKKS